MAALPALTALILLVMVTVMATTVKLSVSDLVVSLTEVATSTGVSKGGPLSLLGACRSRGWRYFRSRLRSRWGNRCR